MVNNVQSAMSIAGSDSGGGAGAQADLKTFAAHGIYGTSVITAITAQNTLGVTSVFELPTKLIEDQIDAIAADIWPSSVKIGMLSSSVIIHSVVEKIKQKRLDRCLVVDPVMVAKGGDRLLRQDAIESLRHLLVPLSTIVTPNIPEAEVLTGLRIWGLNDARSAARIIVNELGAGAVVVKGGHLEGDPVDVFYDGKRIRELRAGRIDSTSTHGTGCTFAASVASNLARGKSLGISVRSAKHYVRQAIFYSFPIGGGHGPVNHFFQFRNRLYRGRP